MKPCIESMENVGRADTSRAKSEREIGGILWIIDRLTELYAKLRNEVDPSATEKKQFGSRMGHSYEQMNSLWRKRVREVWSLV